MVGVEDVGEVGNRQSLGSQGRVIGEELMGLGVAFCHHQHPCQPQHLPERRSQILQVECDELLADRERITEELRTSFLICASVILPASHLLRRASQAGHANLLRQLNRVAIRKVLVVRNPGRFERFGEGTGNAKEHG